MNLPEMPYKAANRKSYQTSFRGYNRTLGAADGEIYDMTNMTSDNYPVLSPRQQRYTLRTLTKPHGIYSQGDKMMWVDGTTFYYDGIAYGTVADSDKQFATVNNKIIIFPDKKYFNLDTLKSKGTYATVAALKSAVTTPNINDIYLVGSTAPYALYYWDGDEWVRNKYTFGSLENGTNKIGVTFLAKGELYDAEAENNTIYSSGLNWGDYFSVGDAVEITGCTVHSENNKTVVIREIENSFLRFYENAFTTNIDFVCDITKEIIVGGMYDTVENFKIDVGDYLIYFGSDTAIKVNDDYVLEKGSRLLFKNGVLYYNRSNDYDREIKSAEIHKKINMDSTGDNAYKSDTITLDKLLYVYKTEDSYVYFSITEDYLNLTGYFTVIDDVCVFHYNEINTVEMVRKVTFAEVVGSSDTYESDTLTVNALNYYAHNPYNNETWYFKTTSVFAGKTGKFRYEGSQLKFTTGSQTWPVVEYSIFFTTQLYFNTKYNPYTEQNIVLKRSLPDMDYICSDHNRLWGCKDDTIYASKLGDPFNFNVFDGLSTDSWSVQAGTAGKFTGCISYLGYPIFFKNDMVYKIYGNTPNNYEGSSTMTLGLANNKSLAIAGERLFYLNKDGIVVYTGGIPQLVSEPLGAKYTDGVAGSDGLNYYISMKAADGTYAFFVYDTLNGLWSKEDTLRALDFAYCGQLNVLAYDGTIKTVSPCSKPAGSTEEGNISWMVQFADFYADSPNKKGVAKVHLRLNLVSGATATAYIKYNGDSAWTTISPSMSGTYKRSYYLPIIPKRSDNFSVKLAGTGKCDIYSMSLEYYTGSQL